MFVMICCVWGCSFILMKRALESFSFLSVGMVRVFFGAVALMLVWKWQKQRWPLTSRDMIPLTAVAIIGYAIPFCVQPYVVGEVQRLADHGGAFGGMMVSFVPLLTILVSIPMLGVYPTKRQFFGVIGGFAWKARYVGADGYVVTGEADDTTQWNFANATVGKDEGWVAYHAGEQKPYTCGTCHTTG